MCNQPLMLLGHHGMGRAMQVLLTRKSITLGAGSPPNLHHPKVRFIGSTLGWKNPTFHGCSRPRQPVPWYPHWSYSAPSSLLPSSCGWEKDTNLRWESQWSQTTRAMCSACWTTKRDRCLQRRFWCSWFLLYTKGGHNWPPAMWRETSINGRMNSPTLTPRGSILTTAWMRRPSSRNLHSWTGSSRRSTTTEARVFLPAPPQLLHALIGGSRLSFSARHPWVLDWTPGVSLLYRFS